MPLQAAARASEHRGPGWAGHRSEQTAPARRLFLKGSSLKVTLCAKQRSRDGCITREGLFRGFSCRALECETTQSSV